MSFFGDIGHFLGHLFGGNDDDQQKKQQQQQQQQQAQAPRPIDASSVPGPAERVGPVVQPQENKLQLVIPGQNNQDPNALPQPLQKAQPKPQPAPQPVPPPINPNSVPPLEVRRIDSGQQPLVKVQPTQPTPDVKVDAPPPEHQNLLQKVSQAVVPGFNGVGQAGKTVGQLVHDAPGFLYKATPVIPGVIEDAKQDHSLPNIAASTLFHTGEAAQGLVRGVEHAGLGIAQDARDSVTGPNPWTNAAPHPGSTLSVQDVADGPGPLSWGAKGLQKVNDLLGTDPGRVEPLSQQAHDQGIVPAIANTGFEIAGPYGLKKGITDAPQAIQKGVDLVRGNSDAPASAPAPAPEVAPGVKSVNPTQAADAAAAAAAAAAQAAKEEQARLAQQANLDVPTFQRNNADQLVSDAQSKVDNLNNLQKVQPDNQATRLAQQQELATAMANDPQAAAMVLRKQLLQKAVGANDPAAAEAGLAPLRDQAASELNKARAIQTARNELQQPAPAPAPVIPEPTPVAPEPAPIAPQPVSSPENSVPASLSAQPEIPVQPTPEPTPAAPAAPELPQNNDFHSSPESVPQTPNTVNGATADAAPLTHDALVKQLGPVAQDLKGNYSKRLPMNIEDLKQNAAGVIANMPDEGVLSAFSTTGPETMVHDAQSFSLARAALERLSQMPDDPRAVQTVTNIMDALDRYVSKSGEGLRIAQEEFDNMPLPMKVRYIVKKIDAANADTKNYQALGDDPAKASVVEATITGHLQTSQQIAERVAAIQGQLTQVADAALQGQKVDTNIKALTGALKTEQRNLAANNGELVKYYSDLVPGRSRGQKVNDFARRMMLASFTGRVNDVLTTSANVANLGAQNVIQGLLAKAVNTVKPGLITDTLRGGSKLFTGGASELKKTAGEIKGAQYAGDLQKELGRGGSVDGRSQLQKTQAPIGRTIQAATEMATNLSAGVRDQRLYQLAIQEAQKSGVPRDLVKDYAEARSAVPSRQMLEAADHLHKEVNNLNDNPISRGLNRVATGIEGKSAVGGFIKNQVVPFTSWLGGNIYNSITDKNVVASFVKTLDSVRKGDPEGIAQNLSKLGNNAVQTYALGYLLTQAGVLTNQNAEGYNDAGAYLHVGDHYIPVGFFGFFAPNMVLGNATYNGLNNPDNGSTSEKIIAIAGQSLENLARSLNAGGALGVDTNLSRSYDALTKPGGGAGDAGATFAAGAAGQFIPSITGDVNALLNNSAANPTHEKADTKALDPNSPSGKAKDVPGSALLGLENRIPGLSQTLPRQTDVAAADLVDRTTHGDRGTPGGEQAKTDKQTKVNQTKDFKARGIPDPSAKNFDDAVQARVEKGEYDKAIEGLQAKLDANQKNQDIPESKNKEVQDQITKLKVTRDGHYDPKVIDLYKKTSLTEWRNMGDPNNDNYDPDTYKLLYNYDQALANASVSRNTTKTSEPFYSAKAEKKSGSGSRGGRSGGGSGSSSNTIGNTPTLGKISLGALAPEKAGSIKIPTIQEVKAGELVKKRKISVGKA